MTTSGYLVEAYVRASDAWDRFVETGSRKQLREAGAILCQALERFAADDELWTRAAHALDNARDGGSMGTTPAGPALQNLRSRVRELAEVQCATAQDQKPGRFWKKAVSNTWRGMKAVGGGALIGANVIAPIDPISKAGSVMGGAGLIESAVRD